MCKLSERIQQDGITMQTGQRDRPPEGERDLTGQRWWDVTLTLAGRKFSIPFGMGPAAGDEPGLAEVMSAVTIGVRAVENSRNYGEWCGEWGFDPDGEGQEEMYCQWQWIGWHLRTFLGSKFDAYLYDTEDDT